MGALIKAKNESASADVNLRATSGGLLYSAPYALVYTARGYGFQAMATVAVASLVVRPTTVAIATLRNQSNDQVLVIERVFAHNLVAVANSEFNIWLCSHPASSAALTNDITVRNSTNGKDAGGSSTHFDNGATVTDNGWFPWSQYGMHTVAVTTPGDLAIAEVGGRIIVPPTGAISMSVVATTTSVTTTCGFHWFEVPASELALA